MLNGVFWSTAKIRVPLSCLKDGAGDGDRTRDVQLGKLTVNPPPLSHLSFNSMPSFYSNQSFLRRNFYAVGWRSTCACWLDVYRGVYR